MSDHCEKCEQVAAELRAEFDRIRQDFERRIEHVFATSRETVGDVASTAREVIVATSKLLTEIEARNGGFLVELDRRLQRVFDRFSERLHLPPQRIDEEPPRPHEGFELMESVMLEGRGFGGVRTSEPVETPMAQVDTAAQFAEIDRRIEARVLEQGEQIIEAVIEGCAQAIAELRVEIAESDKLRGPPGRPGQDAKLPRVKIWREDTVYYEGDCVAFNGALFQAQCDTGKSPLFAKHWICLATAGADGKSIRHRGRFQSDIGYREHDAVLVDGSSFVALRDNPGSCPGSGWQLIAAAGRDGRDGATGLRGERGERGLIGPRGEPAPTITGWRIDRASYSAAPVLSNGIEGAPLELRGLFEQFFNEVAPPART